MRKVTLTLDDGTLKRLDRLARPRAGNKSFVVREAIRLMAEADEFPHGKAKRRFVRRRRGT